MFYREDTTGYESLIKDNYDYYKEYINNKCFVFVIGNKNLSVVVESNNLKHLLRYRIYNRKFLFL